MSNSNLSFLLNNMHPHLNEGDYVFCTLEKVELSIPIDKAIMTFKESEGTTIIVEKSLADQFQLEYTFVASWITLTVHSSLEAVGLTAAFSTALAKNGISCNVVAAFYHDHIFVEKSDAEKALQVLLDLSKKEDNAL
jgi:uncharacterized protein